MKNKYMSPNTIVVTIAVEKHLLDTSNMKIQSGSKGFGSTLSRESNNSWDDEEEE